MNDVREYVSNLDEGCCIQIIKDYNQFEKDGFIGDCALRTIAESFMKNSSPVLWMNLVASEVWRKFCMEYLNSKGVVK